MKFEVSQTKQIIDVVLVEKVKIIRLNFQKFSVSLLSDSCASGRNNRISIEEVCALDGSTNKVFLQLLTMHLIVWAQIIARPLKVMNVAAVGMLTLN